MARLLHQLGPKGKTQIFRGLRGVQKQQELLYETDKDSRREIIFSLDRVFLARFLSTMPEDEARDIIKELAPETQKDILARMQPQNADIKTSFITPRRLRGT